MELTNLKETSRTSLGVWYKTINPNANGETMEIEISYIINDYKGCILNLWHKNGFTPKKMKNCIFVTTYVTDKNGDCWERYNPILIKNTNKIDFKNILEINEKNLNYLLSKCLELGKF